MKAKDKLRATWCKKEKTMLFHIPAGFQTKCDGGYLSGILTDDVARELERRGYDIGTLKFSIEPQKGNKDFDSQAD